MPWRAGKCRDIKCCGIVLGVVTWSAHDTGLYSTTPRHTTPHRSDISLVFGFLFTFLFPQFHYDVMVDAELQAKPQVLLLGHYSTGKTSVSPPPPTMHDNEYTRPHTLTRLPYRGFTSCVRNLQLRQTYGAVIFCPHMFCKPYSTTPSCFGDKHLGVRVGWFCGSKTSVIVDLFVFEYPTRYNNTFSLTMSQHCQHTAGVVIVPLALATALPGNICNICPFGMNIYNHAVFVYTYTVVLHRCGAISLRTWSVGKHDNLARVCMNLCV